MKMTKKVRALFSILLVAQMFPPSPIFAETVQDVPVGETTISSKAEDPLQEYKEKAQNQVPTVESIDLQGVPEVTNESEIESNFESAATEVFEATTDQPAKTPRGGGGIKPFSTFFLIEGDPDYDDPANYHIDKDFAELLRTNASVQTGGAGWSGYGKAPNMLTNDDMKDLTSLRLEWKSSSGWNKLTDLKGIEFAENLTSILCRYNQLSKLDFSQNSFLAYIYCEGNKLSYLNVSENSNLIYLSCSNNELTDLDVSNNLNLSFLGCGQNELTSLDVSKNINLTTLSCGSNGLGDLDLSKNIELTMLDCAFAELGGLDVSKNPKLKYLSCPYNKDIGELDLQYNLELETLDCTDTGISYLNLEKHIKLISLKCAMNKLTNLDVSNNVKLEHLTCYWNEISDITSAFNLSNLVYLDASGQKINIPVPRLISSNEAEVDILQTTAHAGLTVTNGNIPTVPIFTINGDKILLSNISREALNEKYINFQYNGSQLVEGAISGNKAFSGTITFFSVSDLSSELAVEPKKANTGDTVKWTWTITSLTTKKAENIYAKFESIDSGLSINPNVITIKKNGVTTTTNDLENTNLGDLNAGEKIELVFETVAAGDADEWLEIVGRLDWEDDTSASPHFNQTNEAVLILDDEQSDTPKEYYAGILSAPLYFNFGIQNIDSSLKNYTLHSQNYQSNTNVVTDGFYTRIKDDRVSMDGWKLSASLSKFMDNTNREMPNGAGTALKLNQMKIERVTDRDTPQEVVDDSPTGPDVPGTVKSTETLVAGDPAKILVNAQVNQGGGTWQLRMPFDQISLDIPANAGKKGTIYKAKLTWTLNNTP